MFSGLMTALGRGHCNCLFQLSGLMSGSSYLETLVSSERPTSGGVSVTKNPQHSERMPNGDVAEYVRLNPEANRLRLVSPVVRSPQCIVLMDPTGFRGGI